jgi:phage-related protein (TIGR01555 family)
VANTRADAWENLATGLGGATDAASSMTWTGGSILGEHVLESIYNGGGIARAIVDSFPDHALRRGFGTDPATAAGLAKVRALGALARAGKLARLHGGAVIVVGTDDVHVPASEPMAPGPREVRWLRVYDCRYVHRVGAWRDLEDCERFRILRGVRGRGGFTVHRSRVLVVRGIETTDDERDRRNGWDVPVLETCWGSLRDYAAACASVGALVQRASEGVLTMKHLLDALSTDSRLVAARAAALRMGRSAAGITLLEEGETYQYVSPSFAGLPEILDRAMTRVSAESRIPVQILFGDSPGGLNATGEASRGTWDEEVTAWRRDTLDEPLARLLSIGWPEAVNEWPPMREPTAKELAELRKLEADTDAVRVNAGLATPEEIRTGVAEPPTTFDDPIDVATDEAEPAISAPSVLAVRMSELGADRCPHGRSNRCPLCGVEREWAVERDASGAIAYRGTWRAS